ncbi:MAG TPA: hypothetical protein VNP92_02120 [Actinophytocola sp.]|nr:hypothetical protein [Actinophytocola sp.]
MVSEVLPCYVVCDVSLSMTDHIDELHTALREFRGWVHADASVGERVRCCVVGFAETARVLQPLYSVAEFTEPSTLGPGAGTNFGLAFTLLRDAIDRDVRALKANRLRVNRPMVFFLSDGRPTDPATWPTAFAALTDPVWTARPNMIAFGLGDADHDTLGRIGTCRTFLGRDGVRMGTALIASVMSASPRPDHV